MTEFVIINNEINISYNFKNNKKIRIFGAKFVRNNENKCKLIIDGKKYELIEEFNIINKEKIEIKLIEIHNITDMSYMFSGCSSLSNISDISKWKTNNVNNMSYMFSGCSTLSNLPDISKLNTNKITNMNYMFNGCSSLSSLPNISKWNTNKVTDMNCLFYRCSSLSSLPDISKWNTNNVNDMSHMFSDSYSDSD